MTDDPVILPYPWLDRLEELTATNMSLHNENARLRSALAMVGYRESDGFVALAEAIEECGQPPDASDPYNDPYWPKFLAALHARYWALAPFVTDVPTLIGSDE